MRGTFEEPPTGLIPWFSKTKGNTYATIAALPFPLHGKTKASAQEVAEDDWECVVLYWSRPKNLVGSTRLYFILKY